MSITERPDSINNQLEFGHWEVDTVISQKTDKKCIFTIVERLSNLAIWMLVDKGSTGIIQALNEIFKHHPELAVTIKSITFDNGSKFAKTKEMQFDANGNKRFDVYYARAYRSTDRAINECSNKLIRLNVPKGCSMDQLDPNKIKEWANIANQMLRKKYGWRSAQEMFDSMLKQNYIVKW